MSRRTIDNGPLTTTTDRHTLVLACDVCKKPVADTTGYICVDMHASIERLEEEKKRTVDAHLRDLLHADVASLTRLVPWHIYHEACDPHPRRFSDYWYPISEVAPNATCCRTTAHLLEKDWFAHTD